MSIRQTDTNDSIIFYGAGQNALHNMDKYLADGLIPVCFVDSDAQKQYTKFQGDYDVLPLMEAIRMYPDYVLYLTQVASSLNKVREFLISLGIPSARIRPADGLLRKPHHCKLLDDHYFVIDADTKKINISYCCAAQRDVFESCENIARDYERFVGLTKQLRHDLCSGCITNCFGCQNLEVGGGLPMMK